MRARPAAREARTQPERREGGPPTENGRVKGRLLLQRVPQRHESPKITKIQGADSALRVIRACLVRERQGGNKTQSLPLNHGAAERFRLCGLLLIHVEGLHFGRGH